MDIKAKDYTWVVISRHESRPRNSLLWYGQENKGRVPLGLLCLISPNWHGCLSDHADSFELDHFDQNFHLIFWLKVNNDSLRSQYFRIWQVWTPSRFRYLEFWQDLKISIYYVNHVLLVFLRLMGTFKNVFKIRIVQILCWGRTLHLTKDINDQMADSHFQVKDESWHFAKKRNASRYVL